MESDIVKEAIDGLIKARPGASESSDSSITRSLDILAPNRDTRKLSMKRKSVALPVTKCNCGKCSKCVPSPSGRNNM